MSCPAPHCSHTSRLLFASLAHQWRLTLLVTNPGSRSSFCEAFEAIAAHHTASTMWLTKRSASSACSRWGSALALTCCSLCTLWAFVSVTWGHRCWSGTGLDRRALSMLKNLVDTSLDPSKLKIYFTGDKVLLSLLTAVTGRDIVVIWCIQQCQVLTSMFAPCRSLPWGRAGNAGSIRPGAEVRQAGQPAAGGCCSVASHSAAMLLFR